MKAIRGPTMGGGACVPHVHRARSISGSSPSACAALSMRSSYRRTAHHRSAGTSFNAATPVRSGAVPIANIAGVFAFRLSIRSAERLTSGRLPDGGSTPLPSKREPRVRWPTKGSSRSGSKIRTRSSAPAAVGASRNLVSPSPRPKDGPRQGRRQAASRSAAPRRTCRPGGPQDPPPPPRPREADDALRRAGHPRLGGT